VERRRSDTRRLGIPWPVLVLLLAPFVVPLGVCVYLLVLYPKPYFLAIPVLMAVLLGAIYVCEGQYPQHASRVAAALCGPFSLATKNRPMTASLYIQTTIGTHNLPLTRGVAVLAGWAVAALLAAGVCSKHETRDIGGDSPGHPRAAGLECCHLPGGVLTRLGDQRADMKISS
jgi:hypothetical protein